MKQLLSIAIVILALFALLVPAEAQPGYDMFMTPRTFVLGAPTAYAAAASTNTWLDLHMVVGMAKVDFTAYTVGTGTITATLYGSADTTNWWSLTNYAKAIPTTTIYTNYYYPSSTNWGTNLVNMPGTSTTPTASTAGFSTVYLSPVAFTGTGAWTLTANTAPNGDSNASYIQTLGIDTALLPRYVRVVWGGTATNGVTAAVLTARTKSTF